MAVPAFLSSSYYSHSFLGVLDMTYVLTHIVTALTGQNPAWTITDNRPGVESILVKSPVDADGRFFDMTFLNIGASSNLKMSMVLRDKDAATIATRRVNGTASSLWDIHVMSGQFHFCIDFLFKAAAPEYFHAGILDQSPEAQTINLSHCVYGNGSRSAADSASQATIDNDNMMDNAAAALATRAFTGTSYGGASTAIGLLTENGYRRYIPRELWAKPTGEASIYSWAGRCYQQLLCPAGTVCSLPIGARVTVPIDTGTTGVFQVNANTLNDKRRKMTRVA